MDNSKFKKGMATTLAAALICGVLPTQVHASDISGHWAEETMKQWVADGLLKGDGENYHPNDAVTRAQFMAFTNRALKLTETAPVDQFKDVKAGDWFYEEVARAVKAGYTNGTSTDTMSPWANITNQQMYAILGRLATEDGTADLSVIKDLDSVDDWALEDLEDAVASGYVVGNHGKVNPDKLATRAQAITILDRLMRDSRHFALPGVYTVDAKEVTVMDDGIILRDCNIAGDLILKKGVKSVRLDNVTVGGRIIREDESTQVIEASGQWQDGTYEGVAMGQNGQIRVKVTVKDGKIASAAVLEHHEDTTGEIMMSTVMRQINQTGDIKNIKFGNDQTINSDGVLNAVKDALSQASGRTLKPGQSKEAQLYTVMKDGTYIGEANGYGGRMRIQMVVKDGKIADLSILSHREDEAYMVISRKLLTQITDNDGTAGIDTITGATTTTKAMIRATDDAMSQAYGKTNAPGESPESNLGSGHSGGSSGDAPEGHDFNKLTDGSYQGHASGYGGRMDVTVVVSDHKISKITVNHHNETSSYYEKAEKPVIKAVIEKNSTNVDTVSGATATSRGILSAVENALKEFMDDVALADGIWYGQGRGQYGEDAIDNWTQTVSDSRIEAKLTVSDGVITNVEMSYFGDDEGHRRPKAYELIGQQVLENQSADGLYDLLYKISENNPDRDPSTPGFDAISGATNSTRGYVSAIEDAINRAKKFSRDGIEQKVRSLRLVNPPIGVRFNYGDTLDMSDLMIHVEYIDGTHEDLPFGQLKSHGITVSQENPIAFAPEDPADYSVTRRYALEFRDTASTAKHTTYLNAGRATDLIEIVSLEITTDNGETFTVPCNTETFIYNTPKLQKHLKGVKKENIKAMRADGTLAEVKAVTIRPNVTPTISIELKDPVTAKSDPLNRRYRFNNYRLNVISDAKFDPSALVSYYVVSNPRKLTYSEGDTLDLTGLSFTGTDDNYLQGDFGADKLAEYGFTVTPALGQALKASDTQLVIGMDGHEDITFPLTVTKESTSDPHKIEIYDSTGNMKLAVIDLAAYKDPSNPDTIKSWPITLANPDIRPSIPTGYQGHLDQLKYRITDRNGDVIRNFTVTAQQKLVQLNFSSNPEEMKYIMMGFTYTDTILPMESDVPHTIDVLDKSSGAVLYHYDLSDFKKSDNINEMEGWPVVLSSQRAVIPTKYNGHLDQLDFKAYDATNREITNVTLSLIGGMAKLSFSTNPEEMKYIMFGFKFENPKPIACDVPHAIDVLDQASGTVLYHYDLSAYKKSDNINEMEEWPVVLSSQRAVVPTKYKGHLDQLDFKAYDATEREITSAALSLSGGMAKLSFSTNPEEMKYVMFGFKYEDPTLEDETPETAKLSADVIPETAVNSDAEVSPSGIAHISSEDAISTEDLYPAQTSEEPVIE